jgi:NAD(P)-dependent dehydrogenase (short-subunit alcohol dehydrogenase family)
MSCNKCGSKAVALSLTVPPGGILGGQRGTYHAAKNGVIGLTKSAPLECAAHGIRLNTICPGLIHTPKADKLIAEGQGEALDAMLKTQPAERLGCPEEIANAVVILSSEAASLIVDHTLVVDGGYRIQ